MKAAMLVSSLSRSAGGIYDASRWLARAVDAAPGQRMEVFGLQDSYTDQDAPGWGDVKVRTFQPRGPAAFGYAPGMLQDLRRFAPDLVHLQGLWMYPSVAALQWSCAAKGPSVISVHGMLDPWALRNSRWKKVLARVLYEDRNLRNAACLQAGSVSEYEAIRSAGFINPVAMVSNGVHLYEGAREQHPPPAWEATIRPGAKVLLFLGRMHPKKGLDLLLDAWKEATGGGDTGWALVIAGVGAESYEQQLRERSVALGIASSVHFVGPQYHDEKIASYCRADAMILPSYSEGIPMVVLDAWAHGLPVLMTQACNLSIGFDRGAAMRVETKVGSVSEGLRALFAMSDGQRGALGSHGQALAREEFSWDVITGRMVSVYEWALGGGERPACVID